MAEFKISRFRYTWKGNWSSTTDYIKDDVVKYGGSSWVCIRQHTSSTFISDQSFLANISDTDPSPAWIKMADGYSFRGDWAQTTLYNSGDIVDYSGVLYLVVTSHTSSSVFDTDLEKYIVYSSTTDWKNAWTQNTRYGIGDVVKYGAIVYKCIEGHLSSNTSNGLEEDQSKWEIFFTGVSYAGSWSTGTRYKKDDLVKYGGTLFRCKKGHTPGTDSSLNFDQDEFWDVELPGFQYSNEWSNTTVYQVGDIVRHGGYLYYAIKTNYGDNPSANIYQTAERDDPIVWQLLAKGINYRGLWSSLGSYKTGDVVSRGGNLYVALLDTELTDVDDSTVSYLDTSNWELLNIGQKYRGEWESLTTVSASNFEIGRTYTILSVGTTAWFNVGATSTTVGTTFTATAVGSGTGTATTVTEYNINDVVLFQGNTYQANISHLATEENYPGDNGNGFFLWDLLIENQENAGMTSQGDLLTYDLSRSQTGDGSTFGLTAVPLGAQDQVLTSNNYRVSYRSINSVARVRYVGTHGVDDNVDPLRGISENKPWRTVRYACEQLDDGFAGTTTIRVLPGKFYETLPIIIPARTAVVGSELRTTEIIASPAVENLSLDSAYTIAALNRIRALLPTVLTGQTLSPAKTPTNTKNPVIVTEQVQVSFIPPIFDPITLEESFQTVTQTASVSQSAIDHIIDLVDDIVQYIDFFVNSTGTNVTLTGSNTAVTTQAYLNAVSVLEANKEFLAEEATAFISQTFPGYDFDPELCKRDVRRYIDAWRYDVIYTGNYKSLLAARYYRNAVLGSQLEDMFYCRDATGVRNCTLLGLTGSLTPPNVFDLYRLPTGGAYVSLDPGWGPDDNRTWILNRSPYIQGVTTIGTGCVGQKIDGALHNGGNKSIVSNDFTQVLSDGVGAWVTNNGRAELVSVFTYYCHIGYLAKDGGIIRGTNGNCSYGSYGAVSDGIDLLETPKTATLNNRLNLPIVTSFAGDFTDELQILEWENAGQEYTSATVSFVGAGVNANAVFEDFRDNAVFESRLLDASTSAIQLVGGGGYTRVQNNAQINTVGSDANSIVIASNDPNTEADYLGMRIFITSGPGTGQYGYITSYNISTKLVTVSKESDGQPGWDHVIPGTPYESPLTLATSYRIEPRPIFSAPAYSVAEYNTPSNTTWTGIAYGETYKTFTNVTGDPGTGTVETQDGLTAITATFDIIKNGRTYTVSLNNPGAGYDVGDTITIEGSNVGGADTVNDITITVTETTDDSTNQIVSFTYEGTGKSGNFVMIASGSNNAAFSANGENWTTANLPSSGDWIDIAAADKKFVAIRKSSSSAAFSLTGESWSATSLPASREWNAVTYGNNKFVAVAGDQNSGAYSTDGISWTSMSLPTFGDSTVNEWVDVTYGKGKFVAVANSNNIAATSDDGITWEGHIMDVVADSSSRDWVSIAYGNNRFVALSAQGDIAYSFDGTFWYGGSMPTQDGSTAHRWHEIRYAQGVFFAVGDTGGFDVAGDVTAGPSTFAAQSSDGILWSAKELASSLQWRSVAFGNPYIQEEDSSVGKNTPMWIAIATGTEKVNKIKTGTRATGRVEVTAGVISKVYLWDTGSGYIESPSLTIIDPNNTSDASFDNRIADGVLSNPSWTNRGIGYRSLTTTVTIAGNGFADIVPDEKFIVLDNMDQYPGPGWQITLSGNSQRYTAQSITQLGNFDGGLRARVRITPTLKVRDNPEHGLSVSLRENYSQVRLTGHDFLDIGTGNFTDTNYPSLYATGIYTAAPEDEVVEEDGGRVFYTSTDQTGNFRTGELFAVEQATGIVTISADFFDLSGLTEIRLGGVRLGGSAVVIREFSTDPLFTEDSNNIVPTQRAIRAYLSNRLSLGGSEIVVGSITAGQIGLGGPDVIRNVLSLKIVVPVRADFDGEFAGISGSMLAQNMFFKSFSLD